MSLIKAINSGQEHRQKYRKSKAFDYSCHNHGSCSYCEDNRLHHDRKARAIIDEKLIEFIRLREGEE